MQVFRSLQEVTGDQPSVVTIGNFDGVHRGHRLVIASVVARAQSLNARAIAVTFDPHPLSVVKSGADISLITPLETKLELLSSTGLDAVVVLPFTADFASWSAFDFASRILREALRATEVYEGENFRFGKGAEGNMDLLRRFGQDMRFSVTACQPLVYRGEEVSSTRVRQHIAAGEMSRARALLGRSFAVRSTPASGRGYGTRYAVPTVNLAAYADLLPANGVYITTLRIGSASDAQIFAGVTNAGNRPTFGADSYAVETHLFDFEPISLTEDTPLELTFLKRLRGEVRFASPDALRAQIGLDVQRAQRYFALCRSLKL